MQNQCSLFGAAEDFEVVDATAGDTIESLDLLCTGFRPVEGRGVDS